MKRSIRRFAVIAVALAGAGAAVAAAGTASAIVGWEPMLVDGVNPEPAVVQIFSDNGVLDLYGQNCTGTLISTTWVVTAAHCMSSTLTRAGSGPYSPSEVKISFRSGPTNPARSVHPYQIFLMPDYGNADTGGDDVALLHLHDAVTDVAPVPLLYGPQFLRLRTVERWGYGVTSATQTSGHATDDVKRAVEQTLAWGEAGGDESSNILVFTENAGRGQFYRDSLLASRGVTGGAAEGDSGGPVLAPLAGGGYALAGVTYGTIDSSGNGGRDPFAAGVIGLSNRTDTDSRAWRFISSMVTDVRYAG
jgi:secreted trypsin-like serine protease